MADTRGNVAITHGERFESFSLDDGIETIQDALDKFGAGGDTEFRVNGRQVSSTSDLRDGDSIMIVSSRTASGGLKGA